MPTPAALADRALAIQAASTSEAGFQPSPLEPTWIIDGNPTARAVTLTTASDGMLSCALWDCTAGKFKYVFGCDEIVHILEGQVTVEEPGAEYTLRPGDVAFFPAGSTTYWTVPEYVKKFCIHRIAERGLLARVRSRVGRLWKAAA